MKRKKRLSRLLEMILLIQSRPDWRPKRLSEHFGVSETRIYQDIRELVAAGVPIYFSGEGYKISGEFVLGSAALSPAEVLQLLYPSHLFAGGALVEPSQTLLDAKMAACLPRSVYGALGNDSSRRRIDVRSATVRGPLFRRLHDAVAERRRIRIRYASRSSGRTTDREVDPYALIYRRHSWYLIAYCHARREVRKFRISRVRSVVCTALRFPEPKGFSLEEYTRGWWEVFGGEPVNVAIRFRRRVADLIRDRAPRPGETIQELLGGDIIYRVNVRGIEEIGWWVMQYGPDAEVLEPEALRDRIRRNVEQMARMYSPKVAVRRPPLLGVAGGLDSYHPETAE